MGKRKAKEEKVATRRGSVEHLTGYFVRKVDSFCPEAKPILYGPFVTLAEGVEFLKSLNRAEDYRAAQQASLYDDRQGGPRY